MQWPKIPRLLSSRLSMGVSKWQNVLFMWKTKSETSYGKEIFSKRPLFLGDKLQTANRMNFLPFLEKRSNSKVLHAIVLLSNALMQRFVEIRSLVSVVGVEY